MNLQSQSKFLRAAAEEIRKEGHAGWGNTCEQAADAIDTLLRERESAKAAVMDEIVEGVAESLRQKGWNTGGDYLEDFLPDVRAALEAVAPMLASARVPDGWQLVPIDPTGEMIEKGTDQHKCVQGDSWYTDPPLSENDCNAIYKAMLAAAPKPETEE